MGSKIFIDFIKYDFSESMRRLKSELDRFDHDNHDETKEENKNNNTTENNETQENSKNEKNEPQTNRIIENWSEQEVENWLNEKKIHSVICENVKPSNGNILKQLYLMQQNAPEFFYSSISSNKQIATREVALFAYELKILFKN